MIIDISMGIENVTTEWKAEKFDIYVYIYYLSNFLIFQPNNVHYSIKW